MTIPTPQKTPKVLLPSFNSDGLQSLSQTLGLKWRETAYGPQIEVPNFTETNGLPELQQVLLSEYGVIELVGPDTFTFLQGQITNDVMALTDGANCLAGYCSAKGRLLANFCVIRQNAETAYLIVARELAAALTKRLSMFVMRAKTKIVDRSDNLWVLGLLSSPANESASAATSAATSYVSSDSLIVAELADGRRIELHSAAELNSILAMPQTKLVSSNTWRYLDCLAGLPFITADTSELFVPQMVNFELIGGVSFKKGCYPGQEIVARSHYLGKNKRRMLLGKVVSLDQGNQANQLLQPAADVFASSNESAEPIGQVVMSAVDPKGIVVVLFEANLQAAQDSPLRCLDQTIELISLPYDVFDRPSA